MVRSGSESAVGVLAGLLLLGGSLKYDCPVPRDLMLMMTGGHMHEWGKKYVLSYAVTPADTMKDLNRVARSRGYA